MRNSFTTSRRVAPKHWAVNKNSIARRVRGELLRMGLTLGDWAKANNIKSLSQVSMALHGTRRDARSVAIRADLLKLIGGAR